VLAKREKAAIVGTLENRCARQRFASVAANLARRDVARVGTAIGSDPWRITVSWNTLLKPEPVAELDR